MEYKTKSVINNIEEIKVDISFIFRILKNKRILLKLRLIMVKIGIEMLSRNYMILK